MLHSFSITLNDYDRCLLIDILQTELLRCHQIAQMTPGEVSYWLNKAERVSSILEDLSESEKAY